MRFRFWLCVCAMALLAGCQAKVDGSSPETLMKSLGKVLESVPTEERTALANDINAIAPVGTAMFTGRLNEGAGRKLFEQAAKDLDGLTVETIRTKAAEARIAEVQKKKDWLVSRAEHEVKQAREAVVNAQKARADFPKLTAVLLSPKLVDGQPGFVHASLEVTNGTDLPIDRITWQTQYAAAAAPGRVETYQDEYHYSGERAIPPGQTRRIDLDYRASTFYPSAMAVDLVKVVPLAFSGGGRGASASTQTEELAVNELKRAEEGLARDKAAAAK